MIATSGQCYTFKNFTDLTQEESEEVLQGRNDPLVRRWMTSDSSITEIEHLRFMRSLKTSKTNLYFRVERSGEFAGVYSLTDMTATSGVGGFWISSQAKNKMLGISVVFHSIDFLFSSLPIESILGYQLMSNASAIKLNRMLGFEECLNTERRDKSMTYLVLSRKKWAEDTTKNANLINLVKISESMS